MLNSLQNLPVYSEDIWDYLLDMQRYMPSRQDRDNLVREAMTDPSKQRRVQLWDYFFRVRSEDVGNPIKEEIKKLRKAVSDSQRERERLLNELEVVKNEFEHKKSSAEQQVIQKLSSNNKRSRLISIILAVVASPFLIWPVISLLITVANSLSGASGASGTLGSGWGMNFICCYPVGLPLGVAALIKFLGSRSIPENKIQEEITKLLSTTQSKMIPRIQDLTAKVQLDEPRYPEYEQRIQFLEGQLERLLSQIPTACSDEQVDAWLQEDVHNLTQIAIERSGMQEKLLSLLNADNPFCSHSPAEIQDERSIKDVFLTKSHWDKSSDKFKHFHAKRLVIMPDGAFADFHGIYSFRFLLFTEDAWASYETAFDFITGRTMGEKTSRYDYVNVVSIETLKTVRTIQSNNGENIDLDNIPSLSVRLTNQEQVTITFPDEGYFRQFEGGQYFNRANWRYDPQEAAENAVKSFKRQVDEAQRKREIGR